MKYSTRRPAVDADLEMRFQAPPSIDAEPIGMQADMLPGLPPNETGRPGDDRERLLREIMTSSVPSRPLLNLILEVEGIAALSDKSLRRMAGVIDLLEQREGTA